MYFFFSKSFPKIHDIALVCDGNDFFVLNCLADAWDELVKVCMNLIHPTLAMSLVCCMRIHLRANAYYSGNYSGLRLSS